MTGRFKVQDATGVIVGDADGNQLVSLKEGAPSDSAVGYQTGALLIDTTNKRHHINVGTAASSAWARVSPVREIINVTSSTKTLVLADSGSLVVLDLAAGIAITLPQANSTNIGWYCDFLVKTTFTGDMVISANRAADLFYGYLMLATDNDGTAAKNKVHFADQSNDDVINADDNTRGRHFGGYFRIEVAAANMLVCSGHLQAVGTSATPFE